MLCEGAIRFLQQGLEAMRAGDAQQRFEKLSKAGEIILALKSALDLSTQDKVALELDAFYHGIDSRILALHSSKDEAECAAILAELRGFRDAWDVISKG